MLTAFIIKMRYDGIGHHLWGASCRSPVLVFPKTRDFTISPYNHILDSLIDLEMDIPNKITTVSFVTGMRRSVLGFLVLRELAVVRVDQDMNTNFASIHKSS